MCNLVRLFDQTIILVLCSGITASVHTITKTKTTQSATGIISYYSVEKSAHVIIFTDNGGVWLTLTMRLKNSTALLLENL
jgi:hypothetical protein